MGFENDNIKRIKEELKKKKISVKDLSNEQVKLLKEEFEKDIESYIKELEEVNDRVRNIKFKIDNWNNN